MLFSNPRELRMKKLIVISLSFILCFIALGCKRTVRSGPPNLGDAFVYFYDYKGQLPRDPLDAEKSSYWCYIILLREQAKQPNGQCAQEILKRFPRPLGKPQAPPSLNYFMDIIFKDPKLGEAIFRSLVAYGKQDPRFKVDFSQEKDIYSCFIKFAYRYIVRRHPELSHRAV